MTGINHAVTGATVGLAVGQPALAFVAAFVSHFVLDALPHFGLPDSSDRPTGPLFRTVVMVDGLLLMSFFYLLAVTQPASLGLVALCIVGALLPDTAWLYRFVVQESWGRKEPRKLNWFNQFHADIQWGERSYGWLFEIIWLAGVSALFSRNYL